MEALLEAIERARSNDDPYLEDMHVAGETLEPGTDLYTKIADANIRKILPSAFHMESLDEPDLSEKAEAYLKSIGLTDEKIEILREKLGKDYNLD